LGILTSFTFSLFLTFYYSPSLILFSFSLSHTNIHTHTHTLFSADEESRGNSSETVVDLDKTLVGLLQAVSSTFSKSSTETETALKVEEMKNKNLLLELELLNKKKEFEKS
jgi:hypothetical protein